MAGLIVLDTRGVWHLKLAEALGQIGSTVAITPVVGGRRGTSALSGDGLRSVEVAVPPGWGSKTAFLGQRLLARAVRRVALELTPPVAVLLTSPAYAPLGRLIADDYRLVTYTADDYRHYTGWRSDWVREREQRLSHLAFLGIYTSEALRDRALREFAIAHEKTLISPNGTEARFRYGADWVAPEELRDKKGPIVGILGDLSDRLNLDVLRAVAAEETVGTLLFVGENRRADLLGPGGDARDIVVVTGRVPHEVMHNYANAVDIALIPYAATPFNHFCSPLRLFDHLATGVQIFATQACDQINAAAYPNLCVPGDGHIASAIARSCGEIGARTPPPQEIFWSARAERIWRAVFAEAKS